MNEPLYREVYRGIGFHLTHKGYWVFDAVPPTSGSWSDFFLKHETEKLLGPQFDPHPGIPLIRRAIDRFHLAIQP